MMLRLARAAVSSMMHFKSVLPQPRQLPCHHPQSRRLYHHHHRQQLFNHHRHHGGWMMKMLPALVVVLMSSSLQYYRPAWSWCCCCCLGFTINNAQGPRQKRGNTSCSRGLKNGCCFSGSNGSISIDRSLCPDAGHYAARRVMTTVPLISTSRRMPLFHSSSSSSTSSSSSSTQDDGNDSSLSTSTTSTTSATTTSPPPPPLLDVQMEALTRLQLETSTTTAAVSVSAAVNTTSTSSFPSATEHVQHQQVVFDELSTWFAHHGNNVPDNLVAVYQHLARKIVLAVVNNGDAGDNENDNKTNSTIYRRILDVGTGTGVLYSFLLQAANECRGVTLHITGVDVSPRMIELARENAKQAAQKYNIHTKSQHDDQQRQRHTIDLVHANVLEYQLPSSPTDDDDDDKVKDDSSTTPYPLLYDAVIVNACFGNFFDPLAVLQHLSSPTLLKSTNSGSGVSSIFVTHPLGSAFVQQLHQADPLTVPHLLPSSATEWQADYLLHGQVPLTVQEFCNDNITIPTSYSPEDDDDDDASMGMSNSTTWPSMPFYYSHLARVRYTLLPNVLRFRGRVATGYGRGGKKLGFPTANLPSSRLFQQALQNVTTGVYFGWALLEDDTTSSSASGSSKRGRNVRHMAVVNVGYSPTFEGQENVEKIIEAHLILSSDDDDDTAAANNSLLDPPDFYNETMRLELVAFLRREIKFPSFPALIAQIRADVQDSKTALQHHAPFVEWITTKKNTAFWTVTNSNPWIGTSGGDDAASWEFHDMRQYLLQNGREQPPPS